MPKISIQSSLESPKEFYEHLRDTLRGMEPEAGHYLERLAQLAFGGVEAAASS